MARIKNPKVTVGRRNIAFLLMFLSATILGLLLLLLIDYRSQGTGIFKSNLEKVTEQFEATEERYNKLLTSLTSTRNPVSDYSITVLADEYKALQLSVNALSSDNSTENPLTNTISNRLNDVATLRVMNKTLQWEEIIGTRLLTYDACIKAISFRQKASVIVTSLKICESDLIAAQDALADIPTNTLLNCSLNTSPNYILEKKVTAHTQFVLYYTLTSKNKAKEAAAADIQYQKALSDFDKLPDWNTCLSKYLQETSASLSN